MHAVVGELRQILLEREELGDAVAAVIPVVKDDDHRAGAPQVPQCDPVALGVAQLEIGGCCSDQRAGLPDRRAALGELLGRQRLRPCRSQEGFGVRRDVAGRHESVFVGIARDECAVGNERDAGGRAQAQQSEKEPSGRRPPWPACIPVNFRGGSVRAGRRSC